MAVLRIKRRRDALNSFLFFILQTLEKVTGNRLNDQKNYLKRFRPDGLIRSHGTLEQYIFAKNKMQISWGDFEKIDIRSGTIIEVNDFPAARKPSYQLIVDFGEMGTRKSSAQLTALYRKEDLLNRQVIAVVNFPPKQIATFFSECLVLGVYDENNDVILLQPGKPVKNGLRIGWSI